MFLFSVKGLPSKRIPRLRLRFSAPLCDAENIFLSITFGNMFSFQYNIFVEQKRVVIHIFSFYYSTLNTELYFATLSIPLATIKSRICPILFNTAGFIIKKLRVPKNDTLLNSEQHALTPLIKNKRTIHNPKKGLKPSCFPLQKQTEAVLKNN